MSLEKFRNATGPVYVTQAEGETLGAQNLITVDPNQTDPMNQNAYLATLTPAGQQQLAATAPTAPVPPVPPTAPAAPAAPVVPVAPAAPVAAPTTGVGFDASPNDNIGPVRKGIMPPAPKPRGGSSRQSQSRYPFDKLDDPMQADGTIAPASFHLKPEGDETIEDLLKKTSSNVSAANRRYEEPDLDANGQQQMETYEKRTFTRDAEGGYVLDADGKRTSTTETKTRVKMKRTRKFTCAEVNATDPDGAGVRVFRMPLK